MSTHLHKCYKCKTIWTHPDGSSDEAHKCPSCGTINYLKYCSESTVINYTTDSEGNILNENIEASKEPVEKEAG